MSLCLFCWNRILICCVWQVLNWNWVASTWNVRLSLHVKLKGSVHFHILYRAKYPLPASSVLRSVLSSRRTQNQASLISWVSSLLIQNVKVANFIKTSFKIINENSKYYSKVKVVLSHSGAPEKFCNITFHVVIQGVIAS